MDEATEVAWGIIANVSGGDWTKQSQEWQDAATRWRNEYVNGRVRWAHSMLDGVSFIACECDRTEDVRLEDGCIADGEVERLRASGWLYDGVTWVCPEHTKDIIPPPRTCAI